MGAMAVGDVTGDGRADVIANVGGNSPDSRVHVLGQSSGQLAAPVTYPVYDLPAPGPMALADIDGDGRLDLVIPHVGFGRLGVMLQRSDGRLGADQLFGIPDASNYDVRGLAVGDVNGDGRPDVVIANYNYGLWCCHRPERRSRPHELDHKRPERRPSGGLGPVNGACCGESTGQP